MKLPFAHSDSEEAQAEAAQAAAIQAYKQGIATTRDIIAPSDFLVATNHVQLGSLYARTLFVYTYPRFLNTNWLSPVINYDFTMDIGMFIVPQDVREVMQTLR